MGLTLQVGEEYVLTIRDPKTVEGRAIGVSYDAFVDDVQVGLCLLSVAYYSWRHQRHTPILALWCKHRYHHPGHCGSGPACIR